VPTSPVKEIWYNPYSYKAVYYEANTPPIEVYKSTEVKQSLSKLYSEQLSGVKRNGKDWK